MFMDPLQMKLYSYNHYTSKKNTELFYTLVMELACYQYNYGPYEPVAF